MTTNSLAVLYRRVSTDHQDNSLEVQEAMNSEYCKRMGIPTLAQDYTAPDISGSVPFSEREGGKALLARLAFGDVKHLVTAKQGRLRPASHDPNAPPPPTLVAG